MVWGESGQKFRIIEFSWNPKNFLLISLTIINKFY